MSWGNRRFRARQSKMSYERQGLIWFTARNYPSQPPEVRAMIREACAETAARIGGGNAEALLEYVTTGRSLTAIMQKHHIASETTVYRMIDEWYRVMDRALGGRR